jgi:peptidyl-prolyl cis-trans isomerase SurA
MRTTLALLLALLVAGPSSAEEIVDGIAAQVGSDIVLISEIYQIAEPAEKRLRQRGATEKEVATLHTEVLEQMIERALIRQVVRLAELDATESEIDDAIQGIATENDLTVQELQASVEAQGLTFQSYRERLRAEIEQAKVINGMIGARVRVEEEEIRALYDQEYGDQPEGGMEVHLRHILIPFEGEDPAGKRRARNQAKKVLRRIQSGEKFEELATEVSQVNPERGGDIGWFHFSSLAPWMTEAVESLPEGGTSGVIEMPFGCNLLHVVDKQPYEEITYENARKHLADYLYQQRLGEEYADFIEELREQTFIERKGVFADAARLGGDDDTGADSLDFGLGNDEF